MKKIMLLCLLSVAILLLTTNTVFAASDANNGDWSAKSMVLKNTAEAEMMVRSGDIDALNDSGAIARGYSPFTAKNQRPHNWEGGWVADVADPDGTDRIYVGSNWSGKEADGYAQNYTAWKNEGLQDRAFGEDNLTITMSYECSDVYVKNALFQLCIDDFQSVTWGVILQFH